MEQSKLPDLRHWIRYQHCPSERTICNPDTDIIDDDSDTLKQSMIVRRLLWDTLNDVPMLNHFSIFNPENIDHGAAQVFRVPGLHDCELPPGSLLQLRA